MAPRLSVVVSTRNRSHVLRGCLASLADQDLDPVLLEVIVVDNGSTDGTRDLVDEWVRCAPNRQAQFEPRVGLSAGRNTGVGAASGEVIAFTDDDARAHRGWARAIVGALDRAPEVDMLVGRVLLVWPTTPPPWLVPPLEDWYSRVDLGPEPRLLTDREVPYGVNMAVRRKVFAELGGFALDLGRAGRSLVSGEEVELAARVRARGGCVGYDPEAVVTHLVDDARVRRRWVIRRAYAQGRTEVLVRAHLKGPLPRRPLLKAATGSLRDAFVIGLTKRPGPGNMRDAAWIFRRLGHAREAVRGAIRPRSSA